MQTSVETDDSRAVIRLAGRFDFNSHREFRNSVDGAIGQPGVKQVVIDLGAVEYLDSSALGMLLMARDRARSHDKDIALDNCHGAVKQVLDIANFGRLFAIS